MERIIHSSEASQIIQELTPRIHSFMHTEKPIDLQGDVRFIKEYVGQKPMSLSLFVEICKLWTIREVQMMKTYVTHGFQKVSEMKDADIQREHIPIRLWNMYFKPSKIHTTWLKSYFYKAAVAIYKYFLHDEQSHDGLLHVLKIVQNSIHGAGTYGAGNLVRICFRVFQRRMPEAPDFSFFRMSDELDPTWDMLRTLNIHTTRDFNTHFESNYDPGEITYIVCMFLKKYFRHSAKNTKNTKNEDQTLLI